MAAFEDSIKQGLEALRIKAGTAVLMHLDAMVIGQFLGFGNPAGMEALFTIIEEHLGEWGTLIVPTFTYSFTKNEPFDVRETPSTVGILTEVFRRRDRVARSLEPIFSVAASGRRAAEVVALDPTDCFGSGSVFSWLAENEATIACLACDVDRMTFLHHAEQMIPVNYRYMKAFSGTVVDATGLAREKTINYLVRDLALNPVLDVTRFKEDALRLGLLTKATINRVVGWALPASEGRAFVIDKLRADHRYLLRPA